MSGDPIDLDACTCTIVRPMQRERGSGVPIEPAEWMQGDDCPVHPHLLYCERCGTQVVQLETSEETSGQMETERQWFVTRLECGHDVSTPIIRTAAFW